MSLDLNLSNDFFRKRQKPTITFNYYANTDILEVLENFHLYKLN